MSQIKPLDYIFFCVVIIHTNVHQPVNCISEVSLPKVHTISDSGHPEKKNK